MLPAINCSKTYIALIKFVATVRTGNQFKFKNLRNKHIQELRRAMIAIKHTCYFKRMMKLKFFRHVIKELVGKLITRLYERRFFNKNFYLLYIFTTSNALSLISKCFFFLFTGSVIFNLKGSRSSCRSIEVY